MTGVYRDWVDRIAAAGFGILIENEAQGCSLGSVAAVQTFFAALERPAARYTWDVQNLWQSGTFPSLEVYRQLRPLMGALHLKGGRSGDTGHTLQWAAPLDEASWPVIDIVRAVVADGVAPYICLNPSHGQKPPKLERVGGRAARSGIFGDAKCQKSRELIERLLGKR